MKAATKMIPIHHGIRHPNNIPLIKSLVLFIRGMTGGLTFQFGTKTNAKRGYIMKQKRREPLIIVVF